VYKIAASATQLANSILLRANLPLAVISSCKSTETSYSFCNELANSIYDYK